MTTNDGQLPIFRSDIGATLVEVELKSSTTDLWAMSFSLLKVTTSEDLTVAALADG
jgi:hypothetical protein